jgi:hypothetical protein
MDDANNSSISLDEEYCNDIVSQQHKTLIDDKHSIIIRLNKDYRYELIDQAFDKLNNQNISYPHIIGGSARLGMISYMFSKLKNLPSNITALQFNCGPIDLYDDVETPIEKYMFPKVSLEYMVFNSSLMKDLISSIINNISIKVLNFSIWSDTYVFMDDLLDMQNLTLLKLDIRLCEDSVVSFMNKLKINKKLEYFNIRGCEITKKGSEAIVNMLQENTSIKSLAISSILEDLNCILNTVGKSKTLEEFQYYHGEGMVSKDLQTPIKLAELIDNPKFKSLRFYGCGLTDEHIMLLAEKLKTNKTLIKLELNHNNISDQGCIALLEALGPYNKLRILNLSMNKLTNEGTKRIREVYDENSYIKSLTIILG